MTTINHLIELATSQQIHVAWRDLTHRPYQACWLPDRRVIVLNTRAPARAQKCSLAHELGHAWLGHDTHPWLPLTRAEQERAADKWAAGVLVDPARLRAAEVFYDQDYAAIAAEVDVTHHLLTVYRGLHNGINP